MHSNGGSTAKPSATALLAAARDLVEQPLTTLSDAETVELLRGVERAARMLTAVQHRLLIEVNTRPNANPNCPAPQQQCDAGRFPRTTPAPSPQS